MKLAVLLALTVAFINGQQQQYSFNPKMFNPYLVGMNSFDNSYPAFYFPGNKALVYNPFAAYAFMNDQNEQEESEGRFNLASKNRFVEPAQNVQMQRFLFNLFNSAGSTSQAVAGPMLLKTVIKTSVVTTTIPSLSLCIPSNQFSDPAAATTCARRRREIAQMLDEFVLSDDGQDLAPKVFEPSPVESVETTATSMLPPVSSSNYGDISSSKDEHVEPEATEEENKRSKRLFNLLALTTTITSYLFQTTVVPKQVSVIRADAAAAGCSGGAAEPSCLGCIPPGYGVC